MFAIRVADIFPALICTIFYLVVMFLAELSRRITDVVGPRRSSPWHTFIIELIGTAQMCTCVYENGIMVKHYGAWGFFFAVFTLLLIAGYINRGAYVSPLVPIEMWWKGKMDTERLLALLLAQTIGAVSAFRFANNLWYYSVNYSADHFANYQNLPCALVYKVPFLYAFAYEVLGCFLIRLIMQRLPLAYKRYLAPMIVAGFLSFALVFIGVPGLNPVTASSRLQGCAGLDHQWFIMTYWCCPVVGWMLAASLDGKKKAKVKGSAKQQSAAASGNGIGNGSTVKAAGKKKD